MVRLVRGLVPRRQRPWFDAALAELPALDNEDRRRWSAGIALFVARSVCSRLVGAAAVTLSLVAVALGVGGLDLQIEPTSGSLLLVLGAGALGGYLVAESWWLVGLIVGSSISLTSATIVAFGLEISGDHPAETSTGAILFLLVLCAPTLCASWTGAKFRRHRVRAKRCSVR